MTYDEFLVSIDPSAGWHLDYGQIRDSKNKCPICHVSERKGFSPSYNLFADREATRLGLSERDCCRIMYAADNAVSLRNQTRKDLLEATRLKREYV